MTQEDIIRMAREAKFFVKDSEAYSPSVQYDHELTPYLERFAKLVAKHTLLNIDPSKFISHQEGMEAGRLAEREACAKEVDHILKEGGGTYGDAIRARGQA